MALKLGDLVAYLKTDDTQFEKGLDKAHRRFGKFGDRMKAGAAAVGAAAGVALAAGIAGTLDTSKAQAKLSAQLGGGKFAADMGRIAGRVYARGFGESAGEINEALRAVLSGGLLAEDAADADIEKLTVKAQALAQAFNVDVSQAVRAAGQMMRTGMAKDADQAFDILTRGFQQTGDLAGDLLDTYSEYSTQFRKLGLDGARATGLLTQGLKAGARDVDVVADAIKEFSIRAIDGSKSTSAGFKAVGLDAGKMAAQIAKGGPEASAALDLVLDRLRAMKDPVERDAAAVALFGTQAEDLGAALYSLDPSSAVDALGNVTGASDKLGTSLERSAGQRLDAFKRKAQAALVEKIGEALPFLERLGAFASEHSKPLLVMAGIFTGLAATVWAVNAATAAWAAIQAIARGATVAWTAAQWLLNIALNANPIGLVILAVAALVVGILLLWKHSKGFRDFFIGAWGWIRNAAGSAADWIVGKWHALVGFVTGLPGRIRSAASGMWDGIKDSFRAAINWLISKWNNFSLTLGGGSVMGISIPSVTLSTPNIPYLAHGGRVRGAGMAVVGERGPEVVYLPQGATVAPLDSGERGGGPITVNVKAYSDRFSLQQVLSELAMNGAH